MYWFWRFFSISEVSNANEIVQASSDTIDQDTYGVLEQELDNCHELIDIEPDSKWPLYTKVLIMKTMDARKFHAEIGNVQFYFDFGH